ncbi:polysaccharide deacetylase [Arthrobacter sp. MYb227]|uniref:polysaccharide deacetylase n=1 Tax=Arthrobacter sp. MYb227 TaxID=1848601 RepID=UPI000CFCF089|nr:polysaccharide deacetylase [Arthrobacter sp. MYb227]PQZ91568.1 polysaccharide deacetylase [Arthrobacter sp. MYb227]
MPKRKYLAAAVIAACSLVFSGCSATGSPAPERSLPISLQTSTDASAADPSAAPEESTAPDETQVLAQANALAGSYDYVGALKVLEGASGEKVETAREDIKADQAKTVVWEDNSKISHLFFHSLVVDPKRAFDGDDRQQGYLDYMVTMDEFNKIIAELYARDFVLVNPADIAGLDRNGKMVYQKIHLPKGKTPIVLSEDDVSYYEYMDGDGFPSKLLLDENGKVTNQYIDAKGKTMLGSYDMVPLIDDFVEKHPDFSYRGAKGIIALTGYNGVLGYRTSKSQYPDNKNMAKDIATATEVADAMKNTGWVFASHAWGHIDMGKSPVARVKNDMKLWDDEVRPIIGDTDQFIYPFGADIARVEKYSGTKYEMLKKDGFDFFYGVDGTTTAWMQKGDGYLRQARINLDGLQFAKEKRGDRPVLKTFFDVKKVIDPARPK